MRDPLSADVVSQLRSDPTAALAASLILAGSFPELMAWAQRTIVPAAKPNGVCHDKANGAGGSNGAVKSEVPRAKGAGTKVRGDEKPTLAEAPRESAARHDQALLALMRENPEASVTEILRLSGRPRNSTQLSLERLEKAGLVEHASRGKWAVIDPDLLDPELVEAPTPRPANWIAPLSGAHVARHSAGGRVRDELGMAARV